MRLNFLILLFTLVTIPILLSGQDKRLQLEQDKKKIENEIEYTNKLLDQTKASKQTSMNQLVILADKISKREELITTINSEIYFINMEIEDTHDSITILTENLSKLKDEYARMIYFAYKNKNLYNRLMFIFASEDFNQAYQRLKYFQQYNSYRKIQAELIVETQSHLHDKTEKLAGIKSEKENLLVQQQNEKDRLTDEKSQKNNTVQQLNKTEKNLKKSLREKERAAEELQSTIEKIITEEIRRANERATATTDKTKGMALTPEELLVSDNFMNNQGKLPWPVLRGVISGTFGEHPHPVLNRVKVKNNGIDLLTDQDAEARAVFEGEVTRVMSVPNNNNVIIIRHGEYLTVYSNLDKVYVRPGDQVQTKQSIGTVFTNPDEAKTEMHFEVWKAKTLMNPADWLAK